MVSLLSCLWFLGCLSVVNQEKPNCTYRGEVMLGSNTGHGPGGKGRFWLGVSVAKTTCFFHVLYTVLQIELLLHLLEAGFIHSVL